MIKPAFGLITKTWLAPLLTVIAPDGVIVPLAPADAVMVKVGAGLTTNDRALVTVPEAESVTLAVKLPVPAVVGVPEIAPAGLRERPAGRLPNEIDQV
jgi:hypothetical protein